MFNDDSWICVYKTTEPYQIEIVKGILDNNNIIAFELNKKDSSYTTFGEIELLVKSEDVIKAKYIIEKQQI